MFSPLDLQFMMRAILLAKKGRFTTTPNPNVGCVIVKGYEIIGEGWHKKAGTGHAEVNALDSLPIEQTSGSTAYVTLEPCSHYGRTPPCAKRLIDANIAIVYIAMLDPNPLVSGRGVAMLQAAGIVVHVGLLEQESKVLNLGFLARMEKRRPYIQVKLASSIDGKTALKNGESKWITGPHARADVQTYRALSCAILSTAKTVMTDDARLNVREEQLNLEYPKSEFPGGIRQPIKIVLDRQNQINANSLKSLAIYSDDTKIILVRTKLTNTFDKFTNVSEIKISHNSDGGFDLVELIQWCGEHDINNLWVEAGGKLSASLIERDLFDELIVYIAPKIMGAHAQEMLPIGPFQLMESCPTLAFNSVVAVGDDLKIIMTKKK